MSTDRWLLVGGLTILVAALIAGDLFLFNATTTPPQPTPMSTPDTAPTAVTVGSDNLHTWSAEVSAATGIPARAAQAYGQAQLALTSCHLTWNTLAGIAKVESNNGTYGGATLTDDGTATRPIIGAPLDGSAGNRLIPDTDHGALDGDPVHDRAVGPFQFLPQTWHAYAPPGANPQNIDAAALAAGRYLCTGNRNLSTGRDWWAAVLSYNNSMSYAREVFADTNSYAAASTSR
ncbi:MAG TPA: murein transglycosylase [Pseudonocardiaceae bacterium]|jgi:membrane-bound lytic murein transglycosylase B